MFVGTNFGHQSGEPANKPTFWLHSNTKASHTKPPFSPLTVGQKSPFLTLALLLPSCPPPSDPLPFTYPVSSPLPPLLHSYPFLCSGLLLWSLLTPQLPPPPPPHQGQLVCVELTTRQLLHCLLSPSSCPLHNNTQPCSANQQHRQQQYPTPTWPIGEEVWGKGGRSGLMEGTRRVNY